MREELAAIPLLNADADLFTEPAIVVEQLVDRLLDQFFGIAPPAPGDGGTVAAPIVRQVMASAFGVS